MGTHILELTVLKIINNVKCMVGISLIYILSNFVLLNN